MNARRNYVLTIIAALIGSTTTAAAFSIDSLARRRFETHLLFSSTAGQGIFYDGPTKESLFDDPSKSLLSTKAAASETSLLSYYRQPVPQRKDVVVIGGGLAGLSAALYLSQIDPDRHVCILERETIKPSSTTTTTVASLAAAGMLAPQSERLPSGPLLDLCLQSRRLYPDFCSLVETLAQDESVAEYWSSSISDDSTPWSVGYMASGGFLAPAFAGDAVATWSPPPSTSSSDSSSSSNSGATWLDATQVHELEPHLHPDVVGGWWFPEDSSVDARRLTYSLRAACVAAGVEFQENTEVTSLDLVDGRCRGVWCRRRHGNNKEKQSGSSNKYLETKAVLVANGAWMRQLLPVPLEPHKGQSLSLRMPANKPPLLRRVLFAQDSYIVPKADGRIVVGATVEAGSYDPNVTPAGILHILSHALQLVPGLADLPLEETWVGLRPTTPDKGPILGKTPWDNLFLAGGYWRNGVLLAPKTGQMLAALIAGKDDMLSASDQALLDAFAWDRFTSPEGGAKLAANARYAASMHPIHQRASGSGVAAAVGTELGSYSTARSASAERQKDRRALFDSGGDDSLERAAMLGRQDARAFSYDKDEVGNTRVTKASNMTTNKDRPSAESQLSLQPATTTPYEGSADAWTVNHSPAEDDDEEERESLDSIYDKIRQNKAHTQVEMDESKETKRPDPGFRIYHVDSETGESREVPPYTTPEEMAKIVAREKKARGGVNGEAPNGSSARTVHSPPEKEEGDSVLNGYQAIHDASEGVSPEESAQAMKELRTRARRESESLNLDDSEFPTLQKTRSGSSQFQSEDPAMNDVYQRIRENKAASSNVEMTESAPEERPDPGFRIYHVDPETGESREVPPYTTPEEMQRIVAMDKAARSTAPNGSTTPSSTDEQGTLNGGPKCTDQQDEYNEQTFDGYTAIQQANARESRQEELEAMRAARQQNRFLDNVDESQIGVYSNKD